MLSLGDDAAEHAVEIRHVEVARQREVLALPIAAPQERMYVRHAATTTGAVTKVTHQQFAVERDRLAASLFDARVSSLFVDLAENLAYGAVAQRPLAEYVFVLDGRVDLDNGKSGALLTAVVLLFHHQVELTQRPALAIFLPVVVHRLTQPDLYHPAFVFDHLTHKNVCL